MFNNFKWDNKKNTISWINRRKLINLYFENLIFASIDKDSCIVYVVAGENFNQDEVFYIQEDGSILFKCIKKKDIVTWKCGVNYVEIKCKNIISALYFIKHNLIIIIYMKFNNKYIIGYDLSGKRIFNNTPDEECEMLYLTEIENKPVVVCDSKINDKYGRSRYSYEVNKATGELKKKDIAY
jgi:hypothetical protein